MKEWKCVQVNHHDDIGRTIEEYQNSGWSLHTYSSAQFRRIVDREIKFSNEQKIIAEKIRFKEEKEEEKRLKKEQRALLLEKRKAIRLAIQIERKNRALERAEEKRLLKDLKCPQCDAKLFKLTGNKYECPNDNCRLIDVQYNRRSRKFYKISVTATLR